MKTVTTKAIAKVAAVATGLAMATSMLSLAPIAHAASLTTAQVQSILSLLTSFGADSSTIANVQASLTGGTPVSTGTGSTGSSYTFTRDLTTGSKGDDVTALQNALIAKGFGIAAGATGYFGAQTQTAVIAWQKAAGVTPAAGYFGAKSRAAFGGATTGGTTGGTTTGGAGTGTGLKVSLSPTSPNGSVLVATQGIGDIGDFVFANPTSAPINVTGLSFKRTGVSNDSTMTNVYLYNAGTRITDSAGVSASAFNYSDPVAIFTVPAGGTYTVSVRSDIAADTSGQQIGVQLVSVTSNGTLDSSVSFPISSGYQTISAATLATVNYSVAPSPTGATSISPQNDYPLWQDTITVSSNPVKLASLKFTNLGSIDSAYLTNLRLYVDGVQVGSAVSAMGANRSVTFDLSANPASLSTQSHIVKVLANITGGASRTVQLSVQRSSDGMFVDSQLNQPVTPQYLGTTFGAVTTAVVTMSSVTGTTGTSVSLSASSPNSNVAVGASNVKWASFNMLASGENVKVNDLYVTASSSVSGVISGVGGLQNGKVFLNGVQVGSTKNLTAIGAGGAIGAGTDFALGSSLILPAGQTVTVDIYGDAKDTAGTNLAANSSVYVTLVSTASNAQGMTSLQSATVPAANTSGNTISVVSSSLTATKYTGYGNQTVIAGANNVKIGSFTLSAGATEGVTVNTIHFSLAAADTSTLTNLVLKDNATGTQIGSTLTTPSTSNSFAVNFPVPASGTKVIDIYANILSGANVGPLAATITTSTTGTGDVTGASASAASTALQTITVGTGTLGVTRGAGDPASNNVVAGAGSVAVGQFNFAAANSAYTVQNLAILVPNNAATSVTNVTVSYKDVNGATQTQSQPLSFSTAAPATTAPYATATFTGLTMYVPANDSANLDVSVGTPTVASGATSGAAINVTLDTGATTGTFRALNGAGAALAIVNSGTNVASNGTFYVRKSIPTFAMLAAPSATPSSGTALYRFSVTADAAGAIEWTHLEFTVASSTSTAGLPVVTNAYITDEASGVNLLDSGTFATTTGTTITVNLRTNTSAAQYQQVAAGATKIYDLYGTVTNYTTGTSLSISLASDSTATTTASATTVVDSNANVVWSDRSAASHTVSTADWTDGYLLKNFTTNATSYSK
ncbi:MAG: peptidoglycan-binding protein [Candidatus Paceibacterota bacterium]|jgi:hypothetical protein